MDVTWKVPNEYSGLVGGAHPFTLLDWSVFTMARYLHTA